MTIPLRSHADVRSRIFRELCAEYGATPDRFDLRDFRVLHREADAKARTWRRQATNVYNPSTRQWEQR